MRRSVKRLAGTHQLESRMREIRPSGSEGRGAAIPLSLPLSRFSHESRFSGLACQTVALLGGIRS